MSYFLFLLMGSHFAKRDQRDIKTQKMHSKVKLIVKFITRYYSLLISLINSLSQAMIETLNFFQL